MRVKQNERYKKMRCFLIEYFLRLRRWTDQTARLADLVRGFVSTPLERGGNSVVDPGHFGTVADPDPRIRTSV
jgi:hypothetical protein